MGDGRAFTLLEFSWQDELYPPEAPELIAWLRVTVDSHLGNHGSALLGRV